MISTVVMPIGGKGKRMKSFSSKNKLINELNGKPLIDYSLEKIASAKIKKVIIISSKISKEVEYHCENKCKKLNISLTILNEKNLKGNFGGLIENRFSLPDEFLVIYPDLVWACDIEKIFQHHKRSQSLLTLVVRRSDHPEDSDNLKLCPLMKVKEIYSKVRKSKKIGYELNDLLSATGIYIMNKKFFENINLDKYQLNDEVDLFETLEINFVINFMQISAYITSEYIKDCGTPSRYSQVSKDLKNDVVYSSSYSQKQKVLFLDRDGTLINNKKNLYITTPQEVALNKNIVNLYRDFTSRNYIPIVVTNQPQISHGNLCLEDLDKIHCKIQDLLIRNNLKRIFQFIFCPHHPHSNFKGEIKYLKQICFCRKPEIGMFYIAKRYINIDLRKSIMVGDSIRDEEFAKNCGIEFIPVNQIKY